MDACDFSGNRPTADELKAAGLGALIYDKTFGTQTHPEVYRAGLAAAGITTAGIHEETGTEAFAGYQRGARAARIADGVFSPGVFVYYCLADTPDAAGHEQAISEYVRGVAETTRELEFGGYGPLVALRAGQAGSPKLTKLWGVETWHPTRPRSGDPANVDLWRGEGVHLVQMVGPSPIAGTDLDLALRPDWAGTTLEDDVTPEQAAQLTEIQGILNGGGVYPALEARIELVVGKALADAEARLAALIPAAGTATGAVPLKITLTGTAAP